MSDRLFGAVMPIWNGFRGTPGSTWMTKAMNSGLSNLRDGYRLLVIENGSDDGTFEYASRVCQENNLMFLHTPWRMGLAKQYNMAIHLLDCKYFSYFHSDDIVPPGHFERCVNFMEENPDTVMVGGQPIWIDDDDMPVDIYSPNQSAPRTSRAWYQALLQGQCFNVGPVFRVETVKAVGGFNEVATPNAAEDLDMYFRITEKNLPIHIFNDVGYYTRVRSATRPTVSDDVPAHRAQAQACYLEALERVKGQGNV